jgi:hypothetical protein
MGSISDLALLADEVDKQSVPDVDLDDAIDAVASKSTYSAENIRWAYEEKYASGSS